MKIKDFEERKVIIDYEERFYPLSIKMPDGARISIEYVNGKFILDGDKDKIDDGVQIFFDTLIDKLQDLIQDERRKVVEEIGEWVSQNDFKMGFGKRGIYISELRNKLAELKSTLEEKK